MATVAGVGVSKANLDVSVSEGPVVRFDNTTKGITKLLKYLKERDTTTAVCESTGGYERPMVSRLRKTELAVQVGHPIRVRAFARACGYETKTDPKDAQILSRFGQAFPDEDQMSWSRHARNCGNCYGGGSWWTNACRSWADWTRAFPPP